MITPTGSQQATIAFAFDSESGPLAGQTSAGVPESSSQPDETVFENEDSKMTFGGRLPTMAVKNSEIDVATSGQDDMVYLEMGENQPPSQGSESQNVLYAPDISKIPSLSISQLPKLGAEQRKINLGEAITLSRQTDALFNINKTFSAEIHASES